MDKPVKTAVLVTGSAGAIGAAMCEAFQRQGYTTIGIDRVEEKHAHTDFFFKLDIGELIDNADCRKRLQTEVNAILADTPLSALINNAAVQILGELETLEPAQFQTILNVNVAAPLILTQLFLESLKQTRGSVINIGSIHRQLTKKGFISYATSKSALAGLTRSMAIDLGDSGIRVNCIEPAATDTPMLKEGFQANPDRLEQLHAMHPLRRIAQPQEIAALACFLASDEAAFITGATLPLDGGISARLHDPD